MTQKETEETNESEETEDWTSMIYLCAMHQRPYEKLIAWQEAHKLCLWAYDLTRAFPAEERFRLVNQICKSAYSVPMNIAEGNTKRTAKDKKNFFNIAMASLEELHYQLRLSNDLKYVSEDDFSKSVDSINKVSYLLTRLHASIH